uniref:Ethylene-responsive transcription factor 1B-like n=1 Tax=Populus alba TaxID=43335 RepID=A0A4V6A0E7_POPAL|nr:ethylene-responsive transcription factor 1B-like [Populus alba]
MDSSFFHYQNSQFSPESSSSFNSLDSSSCNAQNFYSQPLPFNENDSQEMLLLGLLNEAPINSFDTTSSTNSNYDEKVYESLKEKGYGFQEGQSPILAMKKRHSMNRKAESRKRKEKEMRRETENVVVLEDLGAEYLEELLAISESASPW